MNPGWFHSNWWPTNWWHEGWWLDYGLGAPPPSLRVPKIVGVVNFASKLIGAEKTGKPGIIGGGIALKPGITEAE